MKNIQQIHKKLKQIDKKLYIVGGFCRDYFIEQKGLNDQESVGTADLLSLQESIENFYHSHKDGDIDLVTDALPNEMKEVLKIVGEVGKKYGTCIVSEGGEVFELTTFRKDIGSVNNRKPAEVEFTNSLEEDSKRRDFSCNAMYYEPNKGEFIDPQGGINDINAGIIQFVGDIEKRIEEDVIRILRFVRFKNRYGFELPDKQNVGCKCIRTLQVLKQYSYLLKNIPVERIRQELDKILLLSVGTADLLSLQESAGSIQALQDLKDIDFFKHIIPEIDVLENCRGNKYHLEGDVWVHTKMCIEELCKIINREKIGKERALMLLWAMLLHDIGKAPTYTVGEDGEGHYFDHERIGANIFRDELVSRLKFQNDYAKKIYFITKEHLRVFLIPEMKTLKSRKLMMHKYFDDLLLVSEADNRGRIPAKEDIFRHIYKIYAEFKVLIKTKKFLVGEDIMKKYPDLQGREIGERLQQLNNQILVRDE